MCRAFFIYHFVMKKILLTGANGQLGNEIKQFISQMPDYEFVLTDLNELDICNLQAIENIFAKHKFSFCINAAAYTAVDRAESDQEKAFLVNEKAVFWLSQTCKKYETVLFHISTDFVFDGKNNLPYQENDLCEPLSIYGKSKLAGEIAALQNHERTFVIRTSWLYSVFGANFVKTMLRLAKEKPELKVVGDQIGSPTYAKDLAQSIILMISETTKLLESKNLEKLNKLFGIYHYSNEGVASWYDFAHAIFEYAKIDTNLYAISTEKYPTPALRPAFSVLDKSKIKNNFNFNIPHWRKSLQNCLKSI